MAGLRLSIRSAVFYRRAHLSVLAGTALASAVLVGALLVGDSVRYSLKQTALQRLGSIRYALNSQGRFFRQDLADRVENEAGPHVAPALMLRGVAMSQKAAGDDSRQVNNVQVIGVDRRFWWFASFYGATLKEDTVAVNSRVASKLGIKRGDRISIRFARPSLLPRDAPLSSRKGDDTARGTFTVIGIVPDNELGRFTLNANQAIPFSVFVNLGWLQKTAGVDGRANLLLAGACDAVERLNRAVKKVWRIADAGLGFREFDGMGLVQLESDRIFMDPAVSKAALSVGNGAGVLTYLVNSISKDTVSTAYSFVAAVSSSANGITADMKDDEIVVNRWTADQLSAKPGDPVKVSYYELTCWNKFIEKEREFKVRRIVEMTDIAGEKELGPKFPGLTDADRCSEWDIGMPLEKDKVEDKANEAYWKTYRATPKAFITLKAGQEMWANRFGNLTAVRYKTEEGAKDLAIERLLGKLNPADAGLAFIPVQEIALKAAGEAMDFGQLFLGMSLFLIVAGLMLTGLLFAFGIQQRSEELGILMAVGYGPLRVWCLLVQESFLVAGLGAFAGVLLGTYYTKGLIWALSNYWQGAVANAVIQYHVEPMTLVSGWVASFVCAMVSIIIAIRCELKKSAHELLSGSADDSRSFPVRGWSFITILSIAGVAAALGIIAHAVMRGMQHAVPAFFMAGSLLLVSLLGLAGGILMKLQDAGGELTVRMLGVRNAGRRRGRSLAVTGLLACGCFLVFAVSSMQEDVGARADKRSSGTGGFALFGESSIPIQGDLNSRAGRRKFKLDGEEVLKDAEIVSLKVRDGDDASCLNLNRAQSPRLLGVDPDDFAKRGAFTGAGGVKVWELLKEALPDGVMPGLTGDINTVMWGLEKKVGDVLVYRDEMGVTFKVKLVGSLPVKLSVFQGTVLIPAGAFAGKFPSENGYRMFLVDVPHGVERVAKEAFGKKLGKFGVDVETTVEKLKEFHAVESTYMAMFLVLGGLGLLVGSAGMGIVVMRNIQERRSELALLKAVGYSNSQVRVVTMAEHWLVLAMGLFSGIVSSLAAMWPSICAAGVKLPFVTMALFLCGIVLFNVMWIVFSAWLALRGPLLPALRNE